MLKWPSKDQLNKGVVDIATSMEEVSRVYTLLQMVPNAIRNNDKVGPSVIAIDSVFGKAKSAVAVIAGVRCILEVKGKEQKYRASTILGKSGGLPKALAQALENIVK